MKLIVGLGNPGRKYERTRHNVGFVVVGRLVSRFGDGRSRRAFQGEVFDAEIKGEAASERVLLLCPHTLMNASGRSVREAVDFYRIELSNLLVISDDLNLPLGKLRIRAKGSFGGQKGLSDIIRHLGTDAFARLRVGIGSPPEGFDSADYVLSRFIAEEIPMIDEAVVRAADAAADWVKRGIEYCMNQYNT
jgi:peptidyl-tRNA hydrolase, PTH1 family